MAHSREARAKIARLMAERRRDPDFAAKHRAGIAAYWADPERRAAGIAKMKATVAAKKARQQLLEQRRAEREQAAQEVPAAARSGFFAWLGRGVGAMFGIAR